MRKIGCLMFSLMITNATMAEYPGDSWSKSQGPKSGQSPKVVVYDDEVPSGKGQSPGYSSKGGNVTETVIQRTIVQKCDPCHPICDFFDCLKAKLHTKHCANVQYLAPQPVQMFQIQAAPVQPMAFVPVTYSAPLAIQAVAPVQTAPLNIVGMQGGFVANNNGMGDLQAQLIRNIAEAMVQSGALASRNSNNQPASTPSSSPSGKSDMSSDIKAIKDAIESKLGRQEQQLSDHEARILELERKINRASGQIGGKGGR